MKKLLEFILDDSGKLSMSRALTAIIVLVYLGYAGFVVITTKTVPDIPSGVATLAGALYAANKFSPTLPFSGGDK